MDVYGVCHALLHALLVSGMTIPAANTTTASRTWYCSRVFSHEKSGNYRSPRLEPPP